MTFIFEGMDNCLKDSIIQDLRFALPPATQVLKFSNPPKGLSDPESYQKKHFKDMFDLIALSISQSERNLILNRAHLGEYVYSPIYRNYTAEWIFDLEREFLEESKHSRTTILILLYDSNNDQLRLREDGKSFSQASDEKLNSERQKFIEAFDESVIPFKIKFDLADYFLEGPEAKKQVNTTIILEKIQSMVTIALQEP